MTGRARVSVRLALLVVGDLVVLAAALVLAYLLRFRWEIGALQRVPVAPFAEYLKPLALVLLLVPLLLHLDGLYRGFGLGSDVDQIHGILRAVTIAAALVLAVTFFYRSESFQYSRLTFAYWWLLSAAGLSLLHGLHRRALLARYRRGADRRRALVVGEAGAYLLERLQGDPASGLEIVGCLSEAGAPPAKPAAGAGALVRSAVASEAARPQPLRRLGALADLERLLAAERIEEVVIVDPALSHLSLLELIGICEASGVAVQLVPPIYDLLVGPADVDFVQGLPLVRVDEERFQRLSLLVKRAFDASVALLLLLLLAPLLALIALAIRLDSPGPVFFVQARSGKGGRPFRMFKLRTMVADAERRLPDLMDVASLEEPVFKIADDPRVTRVGRVLRRFSLDEAPQLLNVIRGEMSLVGPRPEELRVAERYDVWQRRRLKAKPGLTGLQQVSRRGSLSLNERVRLDIHYIRNRSLLLDLAILARTVHVVITGRGAS